MTGIAGIVINAVYYLRQNANIISARRLYFQELLKCAETAEATKTNLHEVVGVHL